MERGVQKVVRGVPNKIMGRVVYGEMARYQMGLWKSIISVPDIFLFIYLARRVLELVVTRYLYH